MLTVLSSWRRSYALISTATLAIVVAADLLLYGHPLGWTASIVGAAMLAALAARSTAFLRTAGGRWCALAAIGLLFALVEQPGWLNIAYAALCLVALSIANAMGWESNFAPWLARFGRWLVTTWVRVFLDNGIVMRWLVRRGFSPHLARGMAAWIIPALLSSVFVGLFAWANPVVSDWFEWGGTWLLDFVERLPEVLGVGRIIFWGATATFVWMLLRGRVRRPRIPESASDGLWPTEHPGASIPAGLVVRCLILFNLIFAVENLLDVRFLFNPKALPPGMSYTEYVHRGAYPLVAAALLAGLFVLVTFRPGSTTEASRLARRLVYLWIGQTILLTLSAAWRLRVYVAMSELTRWRVASIIWFLLVGMGLVYIVWRIARRRSNTWLININALTALVVLYPCCFINFDGFIADFNVRHCSETGGGDTAFDVEYCRDLGTPALAALDSVKDRVTSPARRRIAFMISNQLHEELDQTVRDWHSWTWRRSRSASEVAAVAAETARTGGDTRGDLARNTPQESSP